MICVLPVIVHNRFSIIGLPGERLVLFLCGFLGAVALTSCYIAFRFIPLSDASTIISSAPVFVSIVAWVALKEECGVFQAFTIVITLCGVLLISRPTFIFGQDETSSDGGLRTEGILVAAFSCITVAVANYKGHRRL